VIEHVEDHALAVEEMKRVCKPQGIVCVTVPAFMALWGQHDVVNNHYRRYVLPELSALFTRQDDGRILFKNYFNFILFLPILSVRFASRLMPALFKRKGAGSDFSLVKEDALVNKLLYKLFKLEIPVLPRLRLPFGVSILLTWQKR
jgi:SAM-dependent methyltransferase